MRAMGAHVCCCVCLSCMKGMAEGQGHDETKRTRRAHQEGGTKRKGRHIHKEDRTRALGGLACVCHLE